MSSSNVRSTRETRGKTELLNCTNLPGSDSARHNHNAGAGLVGRIAADCGQNWEKAKGPPMGMCKAGALGRGRWLWKGHLDVKWKQAYSESRAQQDAVKLTVRDNTSAQSQADFLCNVISLRSTQSVTETYTASTCSKRVLHYVYIRLRNLGDVKHQIIHPIIDGDVMQYVIWAIEE